MSNPDSHLDPPEEREYPLCPECKAEMWPAPVRMNCITRRWVSSSVWYECRTPDCDECAAKYRAQPADD